jgi:Ca2+-binding EF-hand superfamily protein
MPIETPAVYETSAPADIEDAIQHLASESTIVSSTIVAEESVALEGSATKESEPRATMDNEMEAPKFDVGDTVYVVEPFLTHSAVPKTLREGLRGVIGEIGKDGDALIKLIEIDAWEWVSRDNLRKLRKTFTKAEGVSSRASLLARESAFSQAYQQAFTTLDDGKLTLREFVHGCQDNGFPTELKASEAAAPGLQELVRALTDPQQDMLFDMIDRNHDGKISREEFAEALETGVVIGTEASVRAGKQVMVNGLEGSIIEKDTRGEQIYVQLSVGTKMWCPEGMVQLKDEERSPESEKYGTQCPASVASSQSLLTVQVAAPLSPTQIARGLTSDSSENNSPPRRKSSDAPSIYGISNSASPSSSPNVNMASNVTRMVEAVHGCLHDRDEAEIAKRISAVTQCIFSDLVRIEHSKQGATMDADLSAVQYVESMAKMLHHELQSAFLQKCNHNTENRSFNSTEVMHFASLRASWHCFTRLLDAVLAEVLSTEDCALQVRAETLHAEEQRVRACLTFLFMKPEGKNLVASLASSSMTNLNCHSLATSSKTLPAATPPVLTETLSRVDCLEVLFNALDVQKRGTLMLSEMYSFAIKMGFPDSQEDYCTSYKELCQALDCDAEAGIDRNAYMRLVSEENNYHLDDKMIQQLIWDLSIQPDNQSPQVKSFDDLGRTHDVDELVQSTPMLNYLLPAGMHLSASDASVSTQGHGSFASTLMTASAPAGILRELIAAGPASDAFVQVHEDEGRRLGWGAQLHKQQPEGVTVAIRPALPQVGSRYSPPQAQDATWTAHQADAASKSAPVTAETVELVVDLLTGAAPCTGDLYASISQISADIAAHLLAEVRGDDQFRGMGSAVLASVASTYLASLMEAVVERLAAPQTLSVESAWSDACNTGSFSDAHQLTLNGLRALLTAVYANLAQQPESTESDQHGRDIHALQTATCQQLHDLLDFREHVHNLPSSTRRTPEGATTKEGTHGF